MHAFLLFAFLSPALVSHHLLDEEFGRIDNYYWLVTCLMVLNLGYYLICFRFCTMKPLEMADEQDDHDGECELSTLQKNDTGAGGVV
jgi:peptide/histidine transporter 3/4